MSFGLWEGQMPPDEDHEQLTLAQAAEIMRVSPTTLARWARDGRIPSRLAPDGTRIFTRGELRDWTVATGGLDLGPKGNGDGGE